jgi:hypothetical protein
MFGPLQAMKSESVLVRGERSVRGSGRPEAIWRLPVYFRLLVILAVALLFSVVGTWTASQFSLQIFPHRGPLFDAMLLLTVLAYILLMAIPFMPGIELGLGLILLLGAKGAVLAYVCTLIALSISFFVGRVVPPRLVCRFFHWLHLNSARSLIAELEPLGYQGRLALLYERAPSRFTPFLLEHRYLAIAIAVNIPGNALIGGGGGIGLIAGMSMIVKFRAYIAVLAMAIAPLPLTLALYG